jgi:hypothetical protein
MQPFFTDRLENTFSNSSSIVARGLDAVGPCLFRGCYLVTGLRSTILNKKFADDRQGVACK